MEKVASRTAAPRSPAFVRLVSRRRKVVAWLTASTLVPYYLFVLVAACDRAGFDDQFFRAQTGIGASRTASH